MLPLILHFFEAYKREEGTMELKGDLFKALAGDEGRKYNMLMSKAYVWRKVYLYPALQEWIMDDGKNITEDFIRKYKDGNSYEEVIQKINRKKSSQEKNRKSSATSGRGVPEFTEAQKKRIAGKQYFQCANRPNSELERSINYQCPLWQVEERDGSRPKGNFGPEGYEIDHIIPVSEGGRSVEENGQALCHHCHYMKTQMDRKRTNEISDLMACREVDSSETEDLDFSETEELDVSDTEEDYFV